MLMMGGTHRVASVRSAAVRPLSPTVTSPRFCALLLIAFLACAAAAAQPAPTPATTEQLELIERATENEMHALESPVPFRYQELLEWPWGTETRSVIETSEGRADRIVEFSGEPLSSEQQAKQERRLKKLLSDHDAVKNELQEQKAETQRRIRMVNAFSQAFFFDFAGRENGLLVFDFRPNPEFSPKDRETQMYRGMEGKVWVEPRHERIVQVRGKLVKDVSFGWGIFGRLNKGGIYEISQAQMSPDIWRITTLNVDVKGRMFFLNSFRFMRRESNSHFRPVSESLTYPEAVQTLLATPLPPEDDHVAPSHRGSPGKRRSGR
ncbi:MAG TPA: hypothetical protein VFQ41_09715 [Candidatus Angelobacter sp.]|nr:hypothetical protein [Candidatus Angelobacter sp.]